MRGRVDEARMSLARIRGLKHDPHAQIVEDDLEEILDRIKIEEGSGEGANRSLDLSVPSFDTCL